MDDKKNYIVFYCKDIRCSNFSKLETEGASGTISSMLWVAEGLARSQYNVVIVNDASSAPPHIERGVLFLGLDDCKFKESIVCIHPPKIIICVGVEYSSKFISLIHSSATKVWFWHHNPIKTSTYLTTIKEQDIEKHIFVSLNHALRHIKINASTFWSYYRKITIIYNPIDMTLLNKHLAPPNTLRTSKTIKCAYIGNTSYDKGFNEFIELKNRIDKELTGKFEWHVFGGGLYNLEKITENTISGVVVYGTVGRSDLYKKINEFDFVACGLGGHETFCVAAIEAAFLGKKIITSEKGGQLETLSNFKFKRYIKKIKTHNDLINFHCTTIPTGQMEKFRITCKKKYSIESSIKHWGLLMEGKSSAPCFLGNFLGVIESMGLHK